MGMERKGRKERQLCPMNVNQMVIKSTECSQEAERKKAQKRTNEREERYRNWPKGALGRKG